MDRREDKGRQADRLIDNTWLTFCVLVYMCVRLRHCNTTAKHSSSPFLFHPRHFCGRPGFEPCIGRGQDHDTIRGQSFSKRTEPRTWCPQATQHVAGQNRVEARACTRVAVLSRSFLRAGRAWKTGSTVFMTQTAPVLPVLREDCAECSALNGFAGGLFLSLSQG